MVHGAGQHSTLQIAQPRLGGEGNDDGREGEAMKKKHIRDNYSKVVTSQQFSAQKRENVTPKHIKTIMQLGKKLLREPPPQKKQSI